MINGAHVLIYTPEAEQTRAFLRDVLGLPHVDAGDGWLIFALPPGEVAVHPVEGDRAEGGGTEGGGTEGGGTEGGGTEGGGTEGGGTEGGGRPAARHELYLMCDDIDTTVEELSAKGVEFASPVTDQGWGRLTSIRLPGGAELGIYQPRHRTAHELT